MPTCTQAPKHPHAHPRVQVRAILASFKTGSPVSKPKGWSARGYTFHTNDVITKCVDKSVSMDKYRTARATTANASAMIRQSPSPLIHTPPFDAKLKPKQPMNSFAPALPLSLCLSVCPSLSRCLSLSLALRIKTVADSAAFVRTSTASSFMLTAMFTWLGFNFVRIEFVTALSNTKSSG